MTSGASEQWDAIIIGAGAAGMFCALHAAQRGRRILVLERASVPGKKIRISGGGRCNFTNVGAAPDRYTGSNPRFVYSALAAYPPRRFIDWIEALGIAYHEKKLGQLFFDGSAQQLVDALRDGLTEAGAVLRCGVDVQRVVGRSDNGEDATAAFAVHTDTGIVEAQQVVIATGGPSIPKMGATRFGYGIADHFGLKLVEPRAGLVPFTLSGDTLKRAAALSGVSLPVRIACGKTRFDEDLLFTHRGLSGPAALQISSYWLPGDTVEVDLLPGASLDTALEEARRQRPKQGVERVLAEQLPKRLAASLCDELGLQCSFAALSRKKQRSLVDRVHRWRIVPAGTEGMRSAEVTVGGVDTRALNPKTMEARKQPGLYFIGEVVDVTGWLGGYNFQWAWASGYAAGQAL